VPDFENRKLQRLGKVMRIISTASFKMGHVLVIFIYGTSSGPPLLELKRFNRPHRNLPKIAIRVSNGEPV